VNEHVAALKISGKAPQTVCAATVAAQRSFMVTITKSIVVLENVEVINCIRPVFSRQRFAKSFESKDFFVKGLFEQTVVGFNHFIHFHTHFSSGESHGDNSLRRARNTLRSTAISDSTVGYTPRRGRLKM